MIIVLLLLSNSLSFATAERNIKVWINDFYVMSDVHPFVETGRTFVPIRFIAEELGYKVGWNGENQEVTISNNDKLVKLKIDSKRVSVNDKEIMLEMPARLKQSRTFVPLRAITEIFGEKIDYNAEAHVATIGKNYDPNEFYPLKYYLKDDIFITNIKINFIDYIVRYSNGEKVELNSDDEIFELVDKDAETHESLDFTTEVKEEKQLKDKYYIAPIEEDPIVGSWYGQTNTKNNTSEYFDNYAYIRKIDSNKYLIKRRSLKSNGSEIIAEGYAYYNKANKIISFDKTHITTYATGDFNKNINYGSGELFLKEFDYLESETNSKIYLEKY